MKNNLSLKYVTFWIIVLCAQHLWGQTDRLIITACLVLTDSDEVYEKGITPDIRVYNVDTMLPIIADTLSCMVAVDLHFDTIGARLGDEVRRTYDDHVRVIYKKNRDFSQEESVLIEQLAINSLSSKRLWLAFYSPLWPPFYQQLVAVKISPSNDGY